MNNKFMTIISDVAIILSKGNSRIGCWLSQNTFIAIVIAINLVSMPPRECTREQKGLVLAAPLIRKLVTLLCLGETSHGEG